VLHAAAVAGLLFASPWTDYEDTDVDVLIVSRWDRLLIFGGCNLGALACFVLVFALWPLMMAKPRKFAIL
jgi:hypothetical protein